MKLHFAIDKTNKAKIYKKILLKNYKNHSVKKSNTIVVVGGDGFMLETLKKFKNYKKPFYGLNKGSFGFLMNKFKTKKIIESIKRAKVSIISPLEMNVLTKSGEKKRSIAINDVSLLRQSRQTASLEIIVGKKKLIKKLI